MINVPRGPMEDLQGFFNQSIEGFAKNAWEMLKGSFTASNLDASWWVTVVGGTVRTHVGDQVSVVEHPGMLNLMVQIMAPVMVILVVVQVVLSIFRQSTLGLIRAGAAAVYAIPLTYIVTGLVYLLATATDNLAVWILQGGNGQGENEAMAAILGLFGLTWDPNANKVVLDENFQQWALAKDQGNPGAVLLPAILMLVVWVLAFILTAFMVFRLMALVVLASLTPVAIMSQPLAAAKGLASGFATTMLALLLAKPVAAVVLKIGMVLASTANSMWQFAAGLIAMGMAAAAPVLCMRFMSFLTGSHGEGIIGGGAGMISAGRGRVERHGAGAVRSSTRSITSVGRSARRALRAPVKAGR
jgi:hypothetical protein